MDERRKTMMGATMMSGIRWVTAAAMGLVLIAAPSSARAECGDVTPEGYCEGDVVIWCDDGEVWEYDCGDDGMTCGWSEEIGEVDCVELAGPDCGDVTLEGMCESEVLTWCDSEETWTIDCADFGLVCGYVEEEAGYSCLAPPCSDASYPPLCDWFDQLVSCENGEQTVVDCGAQDQICGPDVTTGDIGCIDPECDDWTDPEYCDGDIAMWCGGGLWMIDDCSEDGWLCQVDEVSGFATCVEPVADLCEGVSAMGQCDGEVVSWCDEFGVTTVDCTEYGLVCGLVDEEVGYSCVAPSCEDQSYSPLCDWDGNLVSCEDGEQNVVDCAADGFICGWDVESDVEACIEPECDEGTYEDICDGSVVVWCDGGAIWEFDCMESGSACGWSEEAGELDCVEATCDGDGFAPYCDGETVVSCGADGIVEEDCAADELFCGFDEASGAKACTASPCGEIGFEGECEGEILVWCDEGQIWETDCAAEDLTCRWLDDESGYICALPGCGDVGAEGACEGDLLSWCLGDELATQDCSETNSRCGWDDESGEYGCIGGKTPISPVTEPSSPVESDPSGETDGADDEASAPVAGGSDDDGCGPGAPRGPFSVVLLALFSWFAVTRRRICARE